MIEVEMNEDIRRFEPKIIGMFTKRQAIAITIGVLYAIPIGLLLPIKDISNKIFVIIILIAPAAACGWIKLNGCYFESLILRILYKFILTPQKRKYVYKNSYRELSDTVKEKEERAKMDKMTPEQRKAYLRKKEMKKKVVYNNKDEKLKIYK